MLRQVLCSLIARGAFTKVCAGAFTHSHLSSAVGGPHASGELLLSASAEQRRLGLQVARTPEET